MRIGGNKGVSIYCWQKVACPHGNRATLSRGTLRQTSHDDDTEAVTTKIKNLPQRMCWLIGCMLPTPFQQLQTLDFVTHVLMWCVLPHFGKCVAFSITSGITHITHDVSFIISDTILAKNIVSYDVFISASFSYTCTPVSYTHLTLPTNREV